MSSGAIFFCPRNRLVAQRLREAGLGTLLIDLLTADEEAVDIRTAHLRFDIGLLAERLVRAAAWAAEDERTSALPLLGLFGASTGAAAAPGRIATGPGDCRPGYLRRKIGGFAHVSSGALFDRPDLR